MPTTGRRDKPDLAASAVKGEMGFSLRASLRRGKTRAPPPKGTHLRPPAVDAAAERLSRTRGFFAPGGPDLPDASGARTQVPLPRLPPGLGNGPGRLVTGRPCAGRSVAVAG